jgi:hypothetical protein
VNELHLKNFSLLFLVKLLFSLFFVSCTVLFVVMVVVVVVVMVVLFAIGAHRNLMGSVGWFVFLVCCVLFCQLLYYVIACYSLSFNCKFVVLCCSL